MSDALIEDEFTRFAERFAGTFRPVPLEALPRWRRARRRGALGLAGLGAAVLAALSLNTLQPAAAPGTPLTDRPVRLAGAHGEMTVRFADRDSGWAAFDDCRPDGECAHFLGRTTDGGRSWRPVALPDLPARGRLMMLDPGPASGLIGVGSDESTLWETNDGGLTWRDVQIKPLLAAVEPPGRLLGVAYKVSRDGLDSWAYHSTDHGNTWRRLEPALGAAAELRESADGRDGWAVAGAPTRVWRLSPEGAAAEPGIPAAVDPATISAVGDGGLLMLVPGRGFGVWRGGAFTPLPAPMRGAAAGAPLRDGALALLMPDGSLIVGGEHEPWVRYTRP